MVETMVVNRHLVLLVILALGCGADDEDHHHDDSADEATNKAQIAEGCKHLRFGPDVELDLTMPSPEATAVHTRYQVTLAPSVDDPSVYGGAFQYTGPGLRHYFITDQATTVSIADAAGQAIPADKLYAAPVAACEQAQTVTQVDLDAGIYTLTIGPTSTETIQLVVHVFGAMHGHGH
jgi:hypothetical protein